MEDEKYSVTRIRTEDLETVRKIARKRAISVPRALQIAIGLLQVTDNQTNPVPVITGTITK